MFPFLLSSFPPKNQLPPRGQGALCGRHLRSQTRVVPGQAQQAAQQQQQRDNDLRKSGVSLAMGIPNSWMVYVMANPSINGWWLGGTPMACGDDPWKNKGGSTVGNLCISTPAPPSGQAPEPSNLRTNWAEQKMGVEMKWLMVIYGYVWWFVDIYGYLWWF